MTLPEFQDLALRALENPGDPGLHSAVEDARHAQPELDAAWRELSTLYDQAGEIFAAGRSHLDRQDGPSMPDKILADLLATTALNQANVPAPSPWSRWRITAASIGIAAAAAVVAWWGLAPTRSAPALASTWALSGPAELQHALTAAWPDLVAEARLPTFRASREPGVISPLVAAQAGPVTFAWIDRAETPTELELVLYLGEMKIWSTTAPPPVTSPVLPPGETFIWQLRKPDGRPVLEEIFVSVPAQAVSGPGDSPLDLVLQAATANPARWGEAVLAYQALPPEVRGSDPGRRIGLWLATEARQPELLAEVIGGR